MNKPRNKHSKLLGRKSMQERRSSQPGEDGWQRRPRRRKVVRGRSYGDS